MADLRVWATPSAGFVVVRLVTEPCALTCGSCMLSPADWLRWRARFVAGGIEVIDEAEGLTAGLVDEDRRKAG